MTSIRVVPIHPGTANLADQRQRSPAAQANAARDARSTIPGAETRRNFGQQRREQDTANVILDSTDQHIEADFVTALLAEALNIQPENAPDPRDILDPFESKYTTTARIKDFLA